VSFNLGADFPSNGYFAATLYQDDAYVYLHFKGDLTPGSYLITKSSNKNNFEDEMEFTTFKIANNPIFNSRICYDYSIE
jgi:hypothetical protein